MQTFSFHKSMAEVVVIISIGSPKCGIWQWGGYVGSTITASGVLTAFVGLSGKYKGTAEKGKCPKAHPTPVCPRR